MKLKKSIALFMSVLCSLNTIPYANLTANAVVNNISSSLYKTTPSDAEIDEDPYGDIDILATDSDAATSNNAYDISLISTNTDNIQYGLPEEETELSNVVSKMYTTLFYNERIVDTNDPNETRDEVYENDGTLDAKSKVSIKFRMEEIKAYHEENGIRENITYTMKLPEEFVPEALDEYGHKILNPDTPIEFEQESGELHAFGGIYGDVNSGYALKIYFENVEEMIDISGALGYIATLNENLETGGTYNVEYPVGGSVSFTVTPAEKPKEEDYKLSVTGEVTSDYSTLDWIVSVKKTNEDVATLPYQTVTLYETIPEQINGQTFSGYDTVTGTWIDVTEDNPFKENTKFGSSMPKISVTYTDGSSDELEFSDWATTYEDEESVLCGEVENNERNFKAQIYFSSEDAIDGMVIKEDDKKISFIASKSWCVLTDMNGGTLTNIDQCEITIPSTICDDYYSNNKEYSAVALLSSALNENKISSVGSVIYDFGAPYIEANLSECSATGNDSYTYAPQEIYTTIKLNSNDNYKGNYFSCSEVPDSDGIDKTNGEYYIPNTTFSSKKTKIGSYLATHDSDIGSFNSISDTNNVIEAGTEWVLYDKVDVDSLNEWSKKSENLAGLDLKVCWQIKEILSKENNGTCLIYKGTNKNSKTNRYEYIVIDPETVSIADAAVENGWSEYKKTYNGDEYLKNTTKPSWKIHLFNTQGGNLVINKKSFLGSFVSNTDLDNNDRYIKSISKCCIETKDGYNFNYFNDYIKCPINSMSYLEGRLVDRNTIFWNFTIQKKNIPSYDNGTIFIDFDNGSLDLSTNSHIVNGQYITNGNIFVKQNDKWNECNVNTLHQSSAERCTIMEPKYGFSINMKDIKTDQYGNITFGFFTGIKNSNSSFKCTAEYIPISGDISKISGSENTGSPISPIHLISSYNYQVPSFYKNVDSTTISDDNSSLVTKWIVSVRNLQSYNIFNWPTAMTNEHYPTYGEEGDLILSDTIETNKDIPNNVRKKIKKHTYFMGIKKTSGCGGALGVMQISQMPYIDENGTYYENTNYGYHWEEFNGNAWITLDKDNLFDATEAEIYRCTSPAPNEGGTFYIYYAGNMEDNIYGALSKKFGSSDWYSTIANGDNSDFINIRARDRFSNSSLVFEYRGTHIGNNNLPQIVYETKTNYKEIMDELKEDDTLNSDGVKIGLTNTVELYNDTCSADHFATTATHTFYSDLSVAKSVQNTVTNRGSYGYNANEASYKINVNSGQTATDSVKIIDYVTKFENVEYISGQDPTPMESGSFDNNSAIDALMACVSTDTLKELTIKAKKVGNNEQIIYQNGTFIDEWKNSKITFKNDDNSGEILSAILTPKSGQIPAETNFEISYIMELDIDSTIDKTNEKTFRQSDYYLGKQLEIYSNAKAEKINGFETELIATCNADISSAFLSDSSLYKTHANSLIKNGIETLSWDCAVYSGSTGKTTKEVHLSDNTHFDLLSMTFTNKETGEKFKLSDLSTDDQEKAKTVVAQIIERNTEYKNVKYSYGNHQYYTKTDEEGFVIENQIGDAETLDVPKGNDISKISMTKNGITEVLLTENQKIASTQSTSTEDITISITGNAPSIKQNSTDSEKLDHSDAVFSVNVDGLEPKKYFHVTYQTLTNWNAVKKELKNLFGDCNITNGQFVNNLSAAECSDNAKSTSGYAYKEAALSKSLVSSDPSNCTSSWKITFNTNNNNTTSFDLNDALSIDGEDAIKKAAEVATSLDMDSIKITRGSDVIYDGDYTKGYSENNFTISKTNNNGFKLSVKDADEKQQYIIEYKTKFDKQTFAANGGTHGSTYTLNNEVSALTLNASGSTEMKPSLPISLQKKCNWQDSNAASWNVSVNTKEVDRTNFILTDNFSTEDEAAALALKLHHWQMTMTLHDGTEAIYSLSNLPDGYSVTNLDGTKLAIENVGYAGFILSADTIPAGTKLSIDYVTVLDKETYGSDSANVTVKNKVTAESNEKATAESESSGDLILEDTFQKLIKGQKNNVITWNVKLALTEQYTKEELDAMSEITVVDKLHRALKVDLSSVKATDPAGNEIAVSTVQKGQNLSMTVKDPSKYENLLFTFTTKCFEDIESLTNQVNISVDGKTIGTAENKDPYNVNVSNIMQLISSTKSPSFTPTARKYVDHELCKDADKYSFTIKEVADEQGTEFLNAYSETVKNDENGNIEFNKINYYGEGAHYYQIYENCTNNLDPTIFTLIVNVEKTEDGYKATDTLLSPENYADIRFDNTKSKRLMDYTVTKIWDDQNDVRKLRPTNLVVSLYQNGKSYNDMSVTLNEDNNWTYTWHNLPIAGGEYEAIEETVNGYETEIIKETDGIRIRNSIPERMQAKLKIYKTIDESYEAFGDATFLFRIRGENGRVYTTSISIENGKTTGSKTIDVEYGQKYTVEEIGRSRYVLANVSAIENAEVLNDTKARVSTDQNLTAEVSFENSLTTWNRFGHTDTVINKIGS